MTPLQAERQLRRHENAAVVRLLGLLEEARRDLRARFAHADIGGTQRQTFQQMLHAVEEAMNRLNTQLTVAMADDVRSAVRFGAEFADSLLPDIGVLFSLNPQLLEAVETYHAGLIRDLTDDARGRMTHTVQLGLLAGKTVPEVSRETGVTGRAVAGTAFFRTRNRAEVIARTEMNRVSNVAIQERYTQAAQVVPNLRKMWLSAHDSRVRPTHAKADGQVVDVDDTFTVGGHPARYPLDPSLPAREAVQCRCRSIPVLAPMGASVGAANA